MEKTLNDKIEGIFKGIVFILFDSLRTFCVLVTKPLSGPVKLVKRIRRKDSEQVRPYVFLFLAFFSSYTFPTLSGAGRVDYDPYAYGYYVDGENLLQRNSIGRIFDAAVERFEAKAILPIVVAVVVGVSVLSMCMRFFTRVAFSTTFRRSLVADAMFFLSGAQVILALCTWMIVDRFGFATARNEDWITWLLSSYRALFASADHLMNSRWLEGLASAMATWILFLPLPFSLRLAQKTRWVHFPERLRTVMMQMQRRFRKRRPSSGRRRTGRSWVGRLLFGLTVTAYMDFLFWLTCTSAGLLTDRLSPLQTPPYRITSVDGKVMKDGNSYKVVATFLLTVSGKTALEFTRDSFRVFVGAKRLDAEMQHSGPKAKWHNRTRTGLPVGDAETLQANDTSGSTLVEPGRWKSFTITSKLPPKVLEFLRQHPDENRITVSDKNDDPAGRLGPLDRTGLAQ